MMTRKWMALGTTGALAVVMAGCGMGKATPPPPVAVTSVIEKPGALVEKEVVSIAATVVKVDQQKRIVTLRNADGDVSDVKVGDEVRNLAQVKKGDEVVATYYESIALTLRKPGEAKPGIESAQTTDRAKLGEKPAGMVANQTTVTATVVGLNKTKGTVTLKGPRGKTFTVTAREPKRLDPVKVGDLIEVVYTEAVMISVDKPVKK